MKIPRTLIGDLDANTGGRVRLCGWVHGTVRRAEGVRVLLRDRTGVVSLVVDAGLALTPETAVEATGTVAVSDDPVGAVELIVDELLLVGQARSELPIDERSTLEERLDWRFLDLRRPRNLLLFAVDTTAERAMREFWWEHGFLELHSPKLRPTPNKSGRELFALKYFDRQAYLAQSPQFYKQMAMASGFERVFEIGPAFRAHPLLTDRHATEFTSVDVEMSWIESHEDVMGFEERWLRHVIAAVKKEHGDEIARFFGLEVVVPELPFPRVTLATARNIAEAAGLRQPPGDLDPKGEQALGRHVERELGHDLVFVTEYPEATRPFYHMRTEDGSDLTRSFDLLWKGMEVTTGAQREHRHERLVQQAQLKGVRVEANRYYIDCFEFGCPPHGGFGFGLSRMLMVLLGIRHIAEATFLHRGPRRLSP